MADFKLQVAGVTAAVNSIFESTPAYFRPYLTGDTPDFTVTVSPADIVFEREQSIQEALEEGFRIRNFPDPYLERVSIQRSFAEFLLDRDTLLFHGSVVAVDGDGYLFTANSGTGKSTHTRLWRQAFGSRAVMVNDDKPFLHIMSEGVWACGSPWSGKHGLDSNIRVPLKGLCILERGNENRICRISQDECLPMLRKQSYRPLDAARLPKSLTLADMLANTVPLWRMQCNKDPQAAAVAYEAMASVL